MMPKHALGHAPESYAARALARGCAAGCATRATRCTRGASRETSAVESTETAANQRRWCPLPRGHCAGHVPGHVPGTVPARKWAPTPLVRGGFGGFHSRRFAARTPGAARCARCATRRAAPRKRTRRVRFWSVAQCVLRHHGRRGRGPGVAVLGAGGQRPGSQPTMLSIHGCFGSSPTPRRTRS